MTSTKIEELIRRLSDDTVKGLMRSVGDAGANPINYTGYTILNWLALIQSRADSLLSRFDYPTGAEIYTTTPLGANAVYYSPSRDFHTSRLSAMGIIFQLYY
jgi:chromosome condensin MukBEF complex kleisin-like MukF subunit